MQRGIQLLQTLVLLLLFLLLLPLPLGESTLPSDLIIDHGDRLVEIPTRVEKVYATTELGTFLTYALEPDAILGWNRG